MPSYRYRAALVLAPSLALLVPDVARAGRIEEFVQLAMHPSDPNVMAVRYAYGGEGHVFTNDGGKTWKLICNTAVYASPTTRVFATIMSDDGTTTTGTFSGMWHDDGHACGWSNVPKYDGVWVAALALDPSDPSITYAATASGGELNGLLRRAANGTWTDLGVKDDVLITDLRV